MQSFPDAADGRLAGLLLGGVSQKVVSLAPCAVIVVRDRACSDFKIAFTWQQAAAAE
jgi:hypothetical protein